MKAPILGNGLARKSFSIATKGASLKVAAESAAKAWLDALAGARGSADPKGSRDPSEKGHEDAAALRGHGLGLPVALAQTPPTKTFGAAGAAAGSAKIQSPISDSFMRGALTASPPRDALTSVGRGPDGEAERAKAKDVDGEARAQRAQHTGGKGAERAHVHAHAHGKAGVDLAKELADDDASVEVPVPSSPAATRPVGLEAQSASRAVEGAAGPVRDADGSSRVASTSREGRGSTEPKKAEEPSAGPAHPFDDGKLASLGSATRDEGAFGGDGFHRERGAGLVKERAAAEAKASAADGAQRYEGVASTDASARRIEPAAHEVPAAQHVARAERLADAMAARIPEAPTRFSITIEPESLGPVQVELRMRGGAVEVYLGAASSESRDVLQAGVGELRDALERRGLELAGADVGTHADRDARERMRQAWREATPASAPHDFESRAAAAMSRADVHRVFADPGRLDVRA